MKNNVIFCLQKNCLLTRIIKMCEDNKKKLKLLLSLGYRKEREFTGKLHIDASNEFRMFIS